MKTLWQHLVRNRELYAWLPVALFLCVAAIFGVHYLTGRPVLDSPDEIVGWCYRFIGIVFAFVLVGFAKPHLFDDVDTRQLTADAFERYATDAGSTFKLAVVLTFVFFRICLDTLETVFLLCLAAYLLWH